jgi:hypothetical protein
VEVSVVPGAMVKQSSVTVTDTTISTPMHDTVGTAGVTYGGGGVVTGYGGVVVGPPGILPHCQSKINHGTRRTYTVLELLVYPLGLTEPDGSGPDGCTGIVVLLGKQVPSPFGKPLSHLQDLEHPSPSTTFPSSHSSPTAPSHFPSPHPAGVAPRVMMYGRPECPSPYVWVPGKTTPSAMAIA